MKWLFFLIFAFSIEAQEDSIQQKTKQKTILIIGDSLSAGYGVAKKDAYPAHLERLLQADEDPLKVAIKVINGSESNILSSAALGRLKFYHQMSRPDLVFIALGGNDGRKMTPPKEVKANLLKAIEFAEKEKIPVLLAEMKMFPNLGKEYIESFEKIYSELAAETSAILIPFFLEGVAGLKEMNQKDGFHPNEAGHLQMAKNLLPHFKPRVKP